MDWSDLHHDDFELLDATVSYGGRALPIAWSVARKGYYGRSRNLFETNLCRVLKALTPPGVEWVIVVDRGFARVSFMRALSKMGVGFIIRVRRDVHLIHGRGVGPLGNRVIARGQIRDLEEALSGEQARFAGRCLITLGERAKSPWYLMTNLRSEQGWSASRVVATYGKRMRVEESFRDRKSMRFGFQLRSVHLTKTVRYERLLAVAAVALLLLINLGAFRLGLGFLHRLKLRRPAQRLFCWAFSPEL